ncbi:hypothetical protein CIPAW_16G048900 [Carya illinoinensis]|uniref:No apical meristem-associated C-terminal domain-containing protein n=1 Tax=Carya illinoinensis TaxID=32201 RepID=A0A8T1N640_CARIL|nr:hypothetical protein CIPAW_16G048900 [Carya illinoinensis]
MEPSFDVNSFFTTLLQNGGQGEGSTPFNSIYGNVVVQPSQAESERRPPTKKSQRGVSFTTEEDNLLVSAWLNISLDTIRGTDQKSTQMWERIYEYYHEHKKKTLLNFCAAIAQIESLHPSGTMEVDKIEKAKILYKENENSYFTMKHCWCLLRHRPKWRKAPRRRLGSASLTLDDDDMLDDNVEVIHERPPGKKAAKEKERKRKSRDEIDVEFNHALARLTTNRNTFNVERKEFYSKVERNRDEHLALKKKKFEAKIMKLDIDGMKPKQQIYF